MVTFKAALSVTRDTTSNWNLFPDFIPKLGEIIVFTDYYVVEEDNGNIVKIPNIKIGDGRTALIHLPFIGEHGSEDVYRSDLGDLAFKDETSAQYTPKGTITGLTFNGTPENFVFRGTPAGRVEISANNLGLPNYKPTGTVTRPNVSVTPTSARVYVATSAVGNGSVTNGVAAQCTMPELSLETTGETLNITWDSGSFTPNTPTQVTMPSFAPKDVMTHVSAELADDPRFIGKEVQLSASFYGSEMSMNANITPNGTITNGQFQGTEETIISK